MAEAESRGGKIIRTGPYPELTLTAVLVGYGLGILIALSIGYASLILGFSIEGSELAAILGFGILRGLMGRSSIIENNIRDPSRHHEAQQHRREQHQPDHRKLGQRRLGRHDVYGAGPVHSG